MFNSASPSNVLGHLQALCGTETRGSLSTSCPVDILVDAGDTGISFGVSECRDSSPTKDSLQLSIFPLSGYVV